jgi:hypothetical protein
MSTFWKRYCDDLAVQGTEGVVSKKEKRRVSKDEPSSYSCFFFHQPNYSCFGSVYFYLKVLHDGAEKDMVALRILRGVTQDKKTLRGSLDDGHTDGRLYPVWKPDHGTYSMVVVVDVDQVVDAVAMLSDPSDKSIKHLIPAAHQIWEYKVLNLQQINAWISHSEPPNSGL